MDILTPDEHPGIALATAYVVKKVPWLNGIRHRWCGMCDDDHRMEKRHYAHHVCHADIICWASAARELADEHAAGICLHEFGHVLADDNPGESDFEAERRADRAVLENFGIEMRYVGPQELQWVFLEELK